MASNIFKSLDYVVCRLEIATLAARHICNLNCCF